MTRVSPDGDQRGAGGGAHEARLDRGRAQLVRRRDRGCGSLGRAHAGHHSRALRSGHLARAGALQHAARRRPSRARPLRARSGAPRCAVSTASRSSCTSSPPARRALARAAASCAAATGPPHLSAAPPPTARRRARPLRADRVARARRPSPRARADRARHRRAPPAHAAGHRRGAARDRRCSPPPPATLAPSCPAAPRAARAGAALRRGPGALPAARAREARAELGPRPRAALPAVPRRSRARREAPRPRPGARAGAGARAAARSAAWSPSACRCG